MEEAKSVKIVQTGKQFTIDLEAMPGAGYMWELAHRPEEIEILGEEVVAISKEIGGSSTQRFRLVATRPGNYSLFFQFKRKWENEPARRHEFSIRAA
jgi:predicted secreted protein